MPNEPTKHFLRRMIVIEEGTYRPRKRGAPGYVDQNEKYKEMANEGKKKGIYSSAEEAAYRISRIENPNNNDAAEILRNRLRYVFKPVFSE
jgi:hypothetical protein